MTTALRLVGLLMLAAGCGVVAICVRQLPEALPAGTPPEIVHIVDLQEEPPRAHFLHVREGHYLPYASLALTSTGAPSAAPEFYLIPLVAAGHPLEREMERNAAAAMAGDARSLERWNAYTTSRLDLSQVRLLVLSTDTARWDAETAVVVETSHVEGVVRPLGEALAPEIIALLEGQFQGIDPERLLVLTEGEVPPGEELLRLLILLGGLAALLGLASIGATLLLRRPGWLRSP